MKRYKYADSLATGSVAAGGTLGFLIPPSGGMIIYAVLTEQSIGRLFMAGVFPGIILTLLFIAAIYLVVSRNPEAGPRGDRSGRAERMAALWRAVPIVGVVLVTIGGMYTGFFTHYTASKGAVIALTRGHARELGDQNIQINAIAPGLTESELSKATPDLIRHAPQRWRAVRSNERCCRGIYWVR